MKLCLLLAIFSLAKRRGTGCEQIPARTECGNEERPLLLTPLIDANQSKLARQKSLVTSLPGSELESYSGYITVDDPKCDSNLFFWFFPAQDDPEKAPLMLWLNGGPGRTSLYGAMLENGPLQLTDPMNGPVEPRKVTWAKYFSMLYVDNPVGVGFSYSRGQCYPTNVRKSTTSLYSFLEQFFVLFPEYHKVDFYMGGQSYAGKYIPVLAHYIYHRNLDNPKVHMPLTGIYLGGAFTDPETMFPEFPDYLYNLGVYTDHTRRMHLKEITDALAKPDHNPFYNDSRDNQERGFAEFVNFYFGLKYQPQDVTLQDDIRLFTPKQLGNVKDVVIEKFMSRPRIQAALHAIKENKVLLDIGFIKFGIDVLSSTKQEMAFLMDRYKVLYYNGNMDPVINVRMGEAFLLSTNWTGQDAYNTSVRLPWIEKGELAGFVTHVQKFTRVYCTAFGFLVQVIIRNCGHDAPSDQPEWTLAMMKRFVDNIPFSFPKENNQFIINN